MIEALIGTATQAAPAFLGYYGQQQTNRMNQDIAREATLANQASARESMAFEGAQAKEQMKFQERMSSTAMQRMKEDYKKAGLNPLLGLSNPASTPSGSAGSGSSAQAVTADMKNPFEAFAGATSNIPSLILQAQKQKEEIGLIKAQKNNVNVDSAVKTKGIPEAEIKNEAYEMLKPIFKSIKEGAVGSSAADFINDLRADKAIRNQELKSTKLKRGNYP